eukprot:TRINITY_DN353_c0_g1_i4.p1 TRINITY_DN353_c0_g1~~TRINITY_DN353_c0_g1_i4.p1  ORF type:complete len:225 (-),score=47.79 TRINITY_DN353_c0_g1_i4:65-739(-)
MSQTLCDQERGVMSYDGPTMKSQYKKKGNTIRTCTCNAVGHRTEFVIVDKMGRQIEESYPIYSLDKKERWNDIKDESKYFISPSISSWKMKCIKTDSTESNKTTDSTDSAGRQARKKIRQEKAKQNLCARKTRKKSNINDNTTTTETTTTTTETIPQPEKKSYDKNEEYYEEQTKEEEQYVLLYGQHLDQVWKRKAICKQCNCSRGIKNKDTKPKILNYDIRVY